MKVDKVDNIKIRVFEISEFYNYSECHCDLTRHTPFGNEKIINDNCIENVINKAIEQYWIKEFELIPTHYENNTQTYKMICKCDM